MRLSSLVLSLLCTTKHFWIFIKYTSDSVKNGICLQTRLCDIVRLYKQQWLWSQFQIIDLWHQSYIAQICHNRSQSVNPLFTFLTLSAPVLGSTWVSSNICLGTALCSFLAYWYTLFALFSVSSHLLESKCDTCEHWTSELNHLQYRWFLPPVSCIFTGLHICCSHNLCFWRWIRQSLGRILYPQLSYFHELGLLLHHSSCHEFAYMYTFQYSTISFLKLWIWIHDFYLWFPVEIANSNPRSMCRCKVSLPCCSTVA